MKKNNIEKTTEIQYLKDRNLLILDFILNKIDKDTQGFYGLMLQMRENIEDAYAKGNLKGLRMVSQDMAGWSKSLPKTDIKELEVLLKNKFADDLSGDKTTLSVLKKVLKNGKISNKHDYRVVHDYVQDMDETDPFYSNLEKFGNMLLDYDKIV